MRGERKKLTLDATSGIPDPRDERASKVRPPFLEQRVKEQEEKAKEVNGFADAIAAQKKKVEAEKNAKEQPQKKTADERKEERHVTDDKSSKATPPEPEKPKAHEEKKTDVAPEKVPHQKSPWDHLVEIWNRNPWYHKRQDHLEHVEKDDDARRLLLELEPIIEKLHGGETDEEIEELLRQEHLREESEREALEEMARVAARRAAEDERKRIELANRKPPAPESIVEVVNSRKLLEEETARISRAHRPDPGLPHLHALSIAYAAEDVLMTGKGWTVLAARISKFLERPVTISNPTQVPSLIAEVKAKAEDILRADAAAIETRKRGPFAVVHSPTLRGRVDEALGKVQQHSWKNETTLGEGASSADYAGCETALKEMSGSRYSLPN